MRTLRLSTVAALLGAAGLAHAQAPAEVPPTGENQPVSTPTDTTTPIPTPSEAANAASPSPAGPALVEESFDTAALGGGEGALSAEELEKLGFGGGSPAVDTDIKVFGFADLNFAYAPMPRREPWRVVAQNHSTFFMGNFNLYLSKNLSENVRTMSEVRFHYAPHGSADLGGQYTTNVAGDTADVGRPVRLGGVEIERIYIEWTIHPLVSVRLGQYLTPYGIWNVDHGSPIYIPVSRPYVIGSQLFPERQTGAEFFGRWDAGNNDTLGYHFTLSNGLGPVVEVRDLDENKGVGGRFFWENRSFGTLKIGASWFYARDTTAVPVASLAGGSVQFTERIDAQSKVLSLAADIQWRWRGVIAQAEAISQQRKYIDGARPTGTNTLDGGATIFALDYNTWGVYGLLGYSFDVKKLNMLPYVMVTSFDEVSPVFAVTKTNGLTVGWNVRPLDSVVCKLAYAHSRFPEGHVLGYGPFHMIQSQVAWAF